MTRNKTATAVALVALTFAGYSPGTAQGAIDPDAVGTVTLAQPAVKANPDDNKITVSGTNAVTAVATRNGWRIPPSITVYAVGQTTGYTQLLTVTLGIGGDWTAESGAVANETYDVWATAEFTDGAMPDPNTQTVGSEMKSVVVNKAGNPVTWIVGGTATYSALYPKRTGANAFITGQGTYSVNAGFLVHPTAPFAFTTIPKDGGVVRGCGVTSGNNVWATIALPVPAALNYNTYFTHQIVKGPNAPPGATPHVINAVAKNR